MARIIYVEDTYGVGFHRVLLRKLKTLGEKYLQNCNPRIRAPPSFPCRAKIARIVKMDALSMVSCPESEEKDRKFHSGRQLFKSLLVVDSEGNRPSEVSRRVKSHFKNNVLKVCGQAVKMEEIVRVAVVIQAHESWLCYGLTRNKRCKNKDWAVRQLSEQGGMWRKQWLSDWAHRINISWLSDLPDFREFKRLLEWLCE